MIYKPTWSEVKAGDCLRVESTTKPGCFVEGTLQENKIDANYDQVFTIDGVARVTTNWRIVEKLEF